MSFSENLKYAISQGGISQSKLAKMTGLTEAAISRYIKGEREPRISQAVKLARALGISLDSLFSDIPKAPKVNLWKDTNPTTRKSSRFVCPYCEGMVYYPQANTKPVAERECRYTYCPHCAMQVIREGHI